MNALSIVQRAICRHTGKRPRLQKQNAYFDPQAWKYIACPVVSEPFARRLQRDGVLFGASDVVLIEEPPNACLDNALRFATAWNATWWAGFASASDGLWRVHSWCVDAGLTIECTPVERTAYFGVRITSMEMLRELEATG